MNTHSPLPTFQRIIKHQEDGLKIYALKDNANPIFIQKQNELIGSLIEVYNSFESLSYFITWLKVEQEMKRLQGLDNQISAHVITIRIRPEGNNATRIEINAFRSC